MAFDGSSLTAYVEENKADLKTKAILGSKTLGLIDIRTGIKSSEKIPFLESTSPFQSGAACGFTTSGATTITQTTLNPTRIMVSESICPKDLEAYFTQKFVPAGANADSLSIASAIVDRKVANIARQIEQAVWQGNTAYTNSTTLKHFNGFAAQVDAGSPVSATASTMNSTNVLTIFQDIFDKLPAAAQWSEGFAAFCGMDVFKLLAAKVTATYGVNHVGYSTDGVFDQWKMVLPGTNLVVEAVPGLNNDNAVDSGSLPAAVQQRVFATYKDNLVFGTDLQSDLEDMEVFYSKDDRVLKFHLELQAGVAVHNIDHVVEYTNS